MSVSTTVKVPAHLAELRKQLEELIARAAELAVAESRLEKVAGEIKAGELWTKGDVPMIGALHGAIEHALFSVLDDAQPGLYTAQAGQDARDVLDLAISRCDDAS